MTIVPRLRKGLRASPGLRGFGDPIDFSRPTVDLTQPGSAYSVPGSSASSGGYWMCSGIHGTFQSPVNQLYDSVGSPVFCQYIAPPPPAPVIITPPAPNPVTVIQTQISNPVQTQNSNQASNVGGTQSTAPVGSPTTVIPLVNSPDANPNGYGSIVPLAPSVPDYTTNPAPYAAPLISNSPTPQIETPISFSPMGESVPSDVANSTNPISSLFDTTQKKMIWGVAILAAFYLLKPKI